MRYYTHPRKNGFGEWVSQCWTLDELGLLVRFEDGDVFGASKQECLTDVRANQDAAQRSAENPA